MIACYHSPLPIPSQVWEDIAMDFIQGLHPSQGKTATWVMVDHLTKYIHFCALPPSISAPQLAELFVQEVARLHRFPRSIVSEQPKL
uniref:Integrase catalytic domain-containing protein n=1 Tax=Nelumbo nucifera TaxID=4432 RepID=A0A822ZHQ5_NELNU|nr:TPA_asm: hypothetical protein HUJ06_002383 [Nelumbo nucifera]